MGAVTGKGLAALIREKFSLRVTAFAMLALLVANFGTTVAEFSGVAAAFSLAHVPPWLAVPPVAVGVWLLVTRGNYRKVERVFLALTAVYVAYFIAGFLAQPGLGQPPCTARWCRTRSSTASGCSPRSPPSARRSRPGASSSSRPTSWTSASRSATTSTRRWRCTCGAVFTDAIDLFIVLACAATLYKHGIVVETAQDAARALAPLAGRAASLLFGFGLLNVSILGACDPAAHDGLRGHARRSGSRAASTRSATRRRCSTGC